MLISKSKAMAFLRIGRTCFDELEKRDLIHPERIDGRVFVETSELMSVPLLSVGRAAKFVGRSWRTAKRWKDEGDLEVFYPIASRNLSPIISKGRCSINEIVACKERRERRAANRAAANKESV